MTVKVCSSPTIKVVRPKAGNSAKSVIVHCPKSELSPEFTVIFGIEKSIAIGSEESVIVIILEPAAGTIVVVH